MNATRQLTIRTTALFLAANVAVAAQVPRGAVTGLVLDVGRRAVVSAQLSIVGTDIRALSDSTGRYRLDGVWPGEVVVSVRRLGFSPDSATLVVRSGETMSQDFALGFQAARIDGQSIVADANHGKMAAFNDRRAAGIGSFVTRAEIERRQPATMSEMLRSVAGVEVTPRADGESQLVRMQRTTGGNTACVIQLYVDGHPYQNGSVDDFPPQTIEGVEVYRSASEIPAAFRTRDAGCGIIALWTRDPEQRRP